MRGVVAKLRRWLRFNLFYLGHPPWDTGVSPPELIQLLKATTPGRALDVGCGTGTNLVTMGTYGWEVVGVDIAWLSVLKARQKIRKAQMRSRVYHADVSGQLRMENTFDLVLDIGCFHSLSGLEKGRYQQNLRAWLGESGTYLLYAHQRISPSSDHGITEEDLDTFKTFLSLTWLNVGDELRPDGGVGRQAVWARFDRKEKSSSF